MSVNRKVTVPSGRRAMRPSYAWPGRDQAACAVAAASPATKVLTRGAPPSSSAATIADPTMMPSATGASSRTCSGLETPKPTAIGRRPSTLVRMRSMSGTVVSIAVDSMSSPASRAKA